jgi:nucleoside-diphosphate-sugar epimerase
MTETLLITGPTGKQGSAVIDALFASSNTSDFRIFALTRHPEHPQAKTLTNKHPTVSLIKGNLDDPETVVTSIGTPIWGVFSVQIPLGDGATSEEEERQAKT